MTAQLNYPSQMTSEVTVESYRSATINRHAASQSVYGAFIRA